MGQAASSDSLIRDELPMWRLERRGIVGIRAKLRNWTTAAVTALAVLVMNIWGGCEKSPVSQGENPAPAPAPITTDVKWQVVFSDPRANFGFRPTVTFDSSGTFGFAIGSSNRIFEQLTEAAPGLQSRQTVEDGICCL